jgi:hypothetical protein
MTTSWYDTSYRKLFFDFHSPGATQGLAADYDAAAWADRLCAAGVQAVSVFTKCGYGYSFYDQGSIRYRHPHLKAGVDMLGEQVTELHRRGLRAIGYYHTFNSEPVAAAHPDWIERNADGSPRGIQICMLSPLTEEWMLPHIVEIITHYDVDAMFFDGTYAHSPCFCPACQRRFAEASGGLAMPQDEKDPAWPAFVAWKLAALREVRQAICDTIHQHRPEVVVSINWAYAPRVPEVVPGGIGALTADIFPDDQVFNGSYFSAYWATQNRPFDIMNSAFLQWWGDWGCKPAIAMQQEVAPVLAHGGLTWIGYQMTQRYNVAPAVMDELGKTLEFVRRREPWLAGASPIPYAAVLHSTAAYFTGAKPAFFIDETSARGAHRLLTESMIPHHLIHEAALLDRLADYKVVILPDQRYLTPELTAALRPWVEAGGVLVSAGLTGTLDADYHDTGRLALADLLGVQMAGVYDQTHAYIEVTDERLKTGTLDMPHLAQAAFAFARPVSDDVETLARLRKIYLRTDGQPLLAWSPVGDDSGYPAITLRRVGQGAAIYVAGDIFRAYQAKNQWNLKAIFANLLRLADPMPFVEVTAPAWLQVTLMRQPAESSGRTADGGRTLVHLVNQHGDRPVDGNNRCVEQVLPVPNVTVRLRCPQRPSTVTLEPAGAPAEWTYENGVLTVAVPEVQIHTIVSVA